MEKAGVFHIEYLQSELVRRMQHNAQYSLRSFARDLNVAPSWLSEVLNNKKGISAGKAEEILSKIGHSAREKELFILSVTSSHARKKSDRSEALAQLKKSGLISHKTKQLDESEFQPISQWYYNAILELVELEDCEHTEKWLAKKLRLPQKLISKAVNDLIRIGWLKLENSKFRPIFEDSETTFDIPSSAIKTYHEQILKKAEQAIFEQPVEVREFLSFTSAFNTKDVSEAKQAIRDFQKDFAKRFYDKKQKKNSVYQLSIQFFRVDSNGGE